MTQEQKAQAYDEALERAKKVHKYSSDIAEIKRMEHIFPELRESEDESTRKRIIALVNAHGQGRFKESMLAWLEKQGENHIEENLEMVKPAWSEEDDSMFQSCIGAVATNDYYKGEEKEQIYDWLKSLKQRLGR